LDVEQCGEILNIDLTTRGVASEERAKRVAPLQFDALTPTLNGCKPIKVFSGGDRKKNMSFSTPMRVDRLTENHHESCANIHSGRQIYGYSVFAPRYTQLFSYY